MESACATSGITLGVCEADHMPNKGNVLINHGGLTEDENENLTVWIHKHKGIRIAKVTHKTPADKVFELIISYERPGVWLSFQVERIPSLYTL